MYEMLVGLPPFYNDKDTTQMLDSILTKHLVLPPWLSKDARSLLQLLTNKNPSKRPEASEIKQHKWF
jgi:serum/glucocorticoid-regulated kinase 2